jgi:polyhydroxyalkanoate synthesis regulator phasin
MFPMTKLATAAVTGVLSLAVTGAAAFAAFQPVTAPAEATAIVSEEAQVTAAERKGAGEALEQILSRLVENGTITQAQKEAILKAVREAAEHERERDRHLKEIWGSLMRLSVDYLGLTKEQVNESLRTGTSLGELADATPGKSREGLISYLVAQVTALIDKAVADGKITQEQGDRAKAGLRDRIVKFVDHKYEKRPAKEAREKDKDKERAKPVQAFTGDLMKAATDYLGVERGQIVSRMAKGESLGQIAGSIAGKSRDGMVQALVTAANANIEAAAASGKLTADQATKAKEQVAGAVEKFVDASRQKKPKA